MSFLNFWALSFAALAPAIVLLYLLKVRRRPLAVSTLMFWERVLQENRRRALFQRLRNLLSLLLHLLIFALILLALARPTFDRIIHQGASVVVILDARARMQAIEPNGESRFTRALRTAQEYTRQASGLRQIAILTADAEPRIAAPFSGDEKLLREHLSQLRATDAGGELEPAIALATDLLASRAGDRRILVFTDRPTRENAPPETPVPVELISVASPAPNVAITRFAARPLPANPETAELLLEVANFSAAPVDTEVEILLDGHRIDVRPFHLAPGQRSLQTTSVLPPPGVAAPRGWMTARLSGQDCLAVDDTAFATIALPRKLSVLLVSEGSWFLEKVLAADTRLAYELLAPAAFRAELAAQFDVVIFDRFVPAEWNWKSSAGNCLFIGKSPLTRETEPLTQPIVTQASREHPVLHHVSLENVTITKAGALALPAEANPWRFESPLKSFEEPLMVTGTRAEPGGVQRFAALAFDVEQSDLPLRVAFPLLVSNTLQWLTQASAGREFDEASAGALLPLAPGENAEMEPTTVAAAAVVGTPVAHDSFQPLRNGFYRIRSGNEESWLAISTFDAAESNLSTAEASRVSAGSPSPAARWAPSLSGLPLWHSLALAALCLFTWEWWLFHRRRTE